MNIVQLQNSGEVSLPFEADLDEYEQLWNVRFQHGDIFSDGVEYEWADAAIGDYPASHEKLYRKKSVQTVSAEDEYNKFVSSICKSGAAILSDLTKESAEKMHMAIGIAGEAGELLDAIKKHAIYAKELDMENVIEELGDLEFYMQGLRALLNLTRQQCIDANMAKLKRRYPLSTYTNAQAHARADKESV